MDVLQGASSKASPVSKAVERLMSRKRPIREATLAWLEAAARTREPEYMQLSSHTELLPLIKAAQAPGAQVLSSTLTPFPNFQKKEERLLLRGCIVSSACSLLLNSSMLEVHHDQSLMSIVVNIPTSRHVEGEETSAS